MAKDLELAYLMDTYGPALTDKQREMLALYYDEDLSLAEIAANCGISRQGVRDAIKRGEAALFELEARLGFVSQQKALERLTERLRRDVRDILIYNDRYGDVESITLAAQDILAALAEIEK